MSDEQHRDGSGSDGGLGDDGDEPTVVIVSRDFLIGSLGRASNALYGAGDVCLDARKLVTSGAGAAALADLIDELTEVSDIIAGMARALKRLEFREDP